MAEVTSAEQAHIAACNRVIIEQLGCAEEAVKPEANFILDLNCDSLDVIELSMAFEERFDIEIADEEAEAVNTVGDAYALVARKRGAL